MRSSLTFKLFVSIFLTTLALTLAMVAAVRWSFERHFFSYIEQRDAGRLRHLGQTLAEWYRVSGGWEQLRGDDAGWQRLLEAPPPSAPSPGPLPPDAAGGSSPAAVTLLDAGAGIAAGPAPPPAGSPRYPAEVDGKTVGWLVAALPQGLRSAADHRFQREQFRTMWLIAALCAALAGLASVLLARAFLVPVRRLARATEQLSAGKYGTRVPVKSPDELGRLAHDFNQLAHTLERNEALRREMVADISHELRTPLAVLRGEVEALLDGVRPLAPETLLSLQDEVILLTQLVDDLYELSLADAGALSYDMAPLDLRSLAMRVVESQQGRFAAAGLSINLDAPAPVFILGDAQRLTQLLNNLLENSLRYTSAGGDVRLAVHARERQATVQCDDSPPGVAPELLPRLFDRLFRVDASRGRERGGAGLGLAICDRIVAAHQGWIRALPSALGGVCIQIGFPHNPRAAGKLAEPL